MNRADLEFVLRALAPVFAADREASEAGITALRSEVGGMADRLAGAEIRAEANARAIGTLADEMRDGAKLRAEAFGVIDAAVGELREQVAALAERLRAAAELGAESAEAARAGLAQAGAGIAALVARADSLASVMEESEEALRRSLAETERRMRGEAQEIAGAAAGEAMVGAVNEARKAIDAAAAAASEGLSVVAARADAAAAESARQAGALRADIDALAGAATALAERVRIVEGEVIEASGARAMLANEIAGVRAEAAGGGVALRSDLDTLAAAVTPIIVRFDVVESAAAAAPGALAEARAGIEAAIAAEAASRAQGIAEVREVAEAARAGVDALRADFAPLAGDVAAARAEAAEAVERAGSAAAAERVAVAAEVERAAVAAGRAEGSAAAALSASTTAAAAAVEAREWSDFAGVQAKVAASEAGDIAEHAVKVAREEAARAVLLLPRPRDGRDGVFREPLPWQPGPVAFGSWARHRGGLWYAARDTDAEPGTPDSGWNCIVPGIADVVLWAGDDGREVAITVETSDGDARSLRSFIAAVVYRGVFSEKNEYRRGDMVTVKGSTWVCRVDGPRSRPGTTEGADEWTLAAKRGADGHDGAAGATWRFRGWASVDTQYEAGDVVRAMHGIWVCLRRCRTMPPDDTGAENLDWAPLMWGVR